MQQPGAVRALRLRLRRLAARWAGLPHTEGTIDAAPAAAARDISLLWLRNATTVRSAIDPASDVVVSMTTHGARVDTAWIALESIARGTTRPGRLVLWVELPARVTWRLRRLRRRGVEIRGVRAGIGVHAKVQHHVRSSARHAAPLVACDDDIVYPPDWLEGLMRAHRRHPDCVVAYRAHRMLLEADGPAPYGTWVPVLTTRPRLTHVATSVAGQLLPARLLDALHERGDAFLDVAPTADDLWLHATAVSIGMRTSQVRSEQVHPPHVPGTQAEGLWQQNVAAGGNDSQAAATYRESDLELLRADVEPDDAC